MSGGGPSDLNEGPVPSERECGSPVRQWTSHDEMVVSVHQDAHCAFHAVHLSHDARIGNRVTDREMVHHLQLRREIEVAVHFIIEERADSGCS